MGYSGDIMHDIVQKELKRNYPASEGWVVSGVSKKIGNDEIFSVSRRRGSSQVVTVGVTFSRIIEPGLVRINDRRTRDTGCQKKCMAIQPVSTTRY